MRQALTDIIAPIYIENCGPMIDHIRMRAGIKKSVDAILKLFAHEKGKCTKKK